MALPLDGPQRTGTTSRGSAPVGSMIGKRDRSRHLRERQQAEPVRPPITAAPWPSRSRPGQQAEEHAGRAVAGHNGSPRQPASLSSLRVELTEKLSGGWLCGGSRKVRRGPGQSVATRILGHDHPSSSPQASGLLSPRASETGSSPAPRCSDLPTARQRPRSHCDGPTPLVFPAAVGNPASPGRGAVAAGVADQLVEHVHRIGEHRRWQFCQQLMYLRRAHPPRPHPDPDPRQRCGPGRGARDPALVSS